MFLPTEDPNVPGSLLKLWLRELSESLIGNEYYESCVQVGRDDGNESHNELFKRSMQIVDSLPPINRSVVLFTMKFLRTVADVKYQAITKMTVANIAMVFAPNFLRCPSENPAVIFENTK